MLLWEARPGDGMHNTLVGEVNGGQTTLLLTVCKPGGSGCDKVIIPLSLNMVQQGLSTGDWIEQHRTDVNGLCTAFRVRPIIGTPYELCWFIKHHNRGTQAAPNYVINDSLGYRDQRKVPEAKWPV